MKHYNSNEEEELKIYGKQLSEGIKKVSKKWPLSKFKTFISQFIPTENDEDQWTFDYESFALANYRTEVLYEPKDWAPEYYQERWNAALFEKTYKHISKDFI